MGFISNHRIFKHFTPQLTRTFLLLALSSANYGFDNQGFNTTQAMDYFYREFGKANRAGVYALETYFLSLLNSLIFIGFLFGAYIGSVVSARYGRRMTVFTMSIWAICSAVVNITAHSKPQILAGRIINYVYVGMELSTIPLYQAEIMPAPVRGFAVSTYQFSILLGGLIINCVCRGTSTIPSNWSWRIPYCLFVIIPIIVSSLIWFCPESPRYLAMKGQDEKALESLTKFRGKVEGFDGEKELALLKEAIAREQIQGSYLELFQGTNRRRTLIALGSNFFLQATGQSFTVAYGAVFIKSLGTVNTFTMQIVSTLCSSVAVALSMLLSDKLGRRKLMLMGSAGQCIFLFILGSMGVDLPVSTQRKTVVVAMKILFGFSFSFGWAPQNYVVTSEVPAQKLRDKTVRLASFVNIFTNFVVAFTIPYLLNAPYANLQSKVGFVFAPLAFCAFIFAYFCIPNMMGKSLEDLDVMFRAGVSARKFGDTDVAALAALRAQENSTMDRHEMEDLEKSERIELPTEVLAGEPALVTASAQNGK